MSYCLITGASGEIGQAIAKKLAHEGHFLYLHYHTNKQKIDQLIKDLPSGAVRDTIYADLSNKKGIDEFLLNLKPGADSVIFAHGNSLTELFQETTDTAMDEMLSMHVKAPWMISRHILPELIKKKMGRIVLISSIWGDVGASCEVVYSSVKGAQNSFVKALGKELAPSGIAVNGVLPGLVATKMNKNLNQEELEMLYSEIPANRAAVPEEVAHVVSFLINPATTYVQGELIKVTGGWQ